jgi:hypothetical protein
MAQHLGNHVRVGFARQTVDEVPTPPEGSDPPCSDDDRTDEQGKREARIDLRRGERECKRYAGKGEI